MSFAALTKKTMIASAMVLPLALAGCGKDDGDAAASSSSSSSTTSSSRTTTTTTSTEHKDKPSPTTITPSEEAKKDEPHPEQPPRGEGEDQQPAGEGNAPEPEPVHGAPANSQDQEEIERLVYGMGEQPTLRSFLEYTNNNTCRRVAEANGGYAALDPSKVPDVNLAEKPNINTGVGEVSDVQVSGDTASARVTSTGEHPETTTMRFLKEDGRWKLCD